MGNPELPVPDGLLLRPFRGVRFTVDDPAKVTSPPYDLIAEGDVRALLDSHPNNVVRLILPCSSPPQSPEGHPSAPGSLTHNTPPSAAPHHNKTSSTAAHHSTTPGVTSHHSTTPGVTSHHAAPAATAADEQPAATAVSPALGPAVSTRPSAPDDQSAPDTAVSIPQPHDSISAHKHDAEIAAGDHDSDTSPAPIGHHPAGTRDNAAATRYDIPPEETAEQLHDDHPGARRPDDERPESEQLSDEHLRGEQSEDEQPTGKHLKDRQPRHEQPRSEQYERSHDERLADSDKQLNDIRPGDERQGDAHGDVAVQPSADIPERSANERYCEARDTLLAWLDARVLVADEQPALYVYEQHGLGVLQRGLIGDVALADPAQRIILPHEDIFPGPVADRLALMSTTQANLEPIFLLYDGGQGTATLMVDHVASTRPPLVTADTQDGLRHRLWAITDPAEVDAVNADLRNRQALIADGHHRYATYRVLQRQEHAARAGQVPTSTSWPAPTTPASTTPQPPLTSPLNTPPHLDAQPEPTPAPPRGAQPSAPPATPVQDSTPNAAPPQGPANNPTPAPDPAANAEPAQGPASKTEPGQVPEPAATSAPGAQHPTGQHARGGEQGQPTLGPWDFGLALLVDSTAYPPDLKAIHRVIPGLSLTEAAAKAKGSWRVHDHATLDQGLAALQAAGEPAFLLAGEGGCHLLTNPDPVQLARAMPPDRSDRWNSLNISILSEFVLPKVWGMQDDQQAVRIVHHDPEAALQLALDTGGTAVILKPLAVDDVLAIAAGGERVPRKSTSFGPKPVTGLVLRTFATG
ncbi:DUF1015 family protein [Nonomuraea sp. NPDC050022]|uniref:DUF1015 family protein n=1 Tax=Nonomuraea sp. NPDC050022 TaxID=3364358 RepID=UPI0037B3AFB4